MMADQPAQRYLVVANQTAQSRELINELKRLAAEGPSEFVLLVPASPPQHGLTWDETQIKAAAREIGERAQRHYEEVGLTVSSTIVGSGSPVLAIEDELESNPGAYSGIVLSTLPLGLSRWLKLDVVSAVKQRTRLPVIHTIAESTPPVATPSRQA
jgi:hypothetical protein